MSDSTWLLLFLLPSAALRSPQFTPHQQQHEASCVKNNRRQIFAASAKSFTSARLLTLYCHTSDPRHTTFLSLPRPAFAAGWSPAANHQQAASDEGDWQVLRAAAAAAAVSGMHGWADFSRLNPSFIVNHHSAARGAHYLQYCAIKHIICS
jgi:hypothetical protein